MSRKVDEVRVIIALTEASPVQELWQAAIEACEDSPADVLVVYVDDERWQRAASLPFTREIPKLGGCAVDFTARRAERLFADAVAAIKGELDALAEQSGRAVSFETLPGSDHERTKRLIGPGARHMLIAPAALMQFPVYAELTRFEIEVRIVESSLHQ